VAQKRPELFLKVISAIVKKKPEILAGWKIYILGEGKLKDSLQKQININDLAEIIKITYKDDISTYLATSRVFVSTQDYENFTSLSMLEAMYYRNAIIAFNVGQTNQFVQHNGNGFLVKNADVYEMAEALIQYIESSPEKQKAMGDFSRRIVDDIHNVDNYLRDMENFWSLVEFNSLK
jgi:glycosyltransferase involved in cell wall biosynthesis